MSQQKFKVPKGNWKSYNKDSLVFILNEGKDYLEYTIIESEKLTKRAYALILLLSTILSALIGFTFNKISSSATNDKSSYLGFFFTIIISVIIIYLIKLIFPKYFMVKGRKPDELAKEEYLNTPSLTPEENYKMYIIQEIENCQNKIKYNLGINYKRASLLKNIMLTTSILFPIFLIIAFITSNS